MEETQLLAKALAQNWYTLLLIMSHCPELHYMATSESRGGGKWRLAVCPGRRRECGLW